MKTDTLMPDCPPVFARAQGITVHPATDDRQCELAERIMRLCGGLGYRAGEVSLNSSGMAARAARYIWFKRGKIPSDIRILDAASAGVEAVWVAWRSGRKNWDARRTELASVAWRAAAVSINHDSAQGRTGQKAGSSDHTGAHSTPLDQAALELAKRDLEAWADNRLDSDYDALQIARREAALTRAASVLDLHAVGQKGAAERKRFAFLAAIVNGSDLPAAAKAAGLTIRSAINSLKDGKVFERMGLTMPRGMRAGYLQ